jgi:hypothetical protein
MMEVLYADQQTMNDTNRYILDSIKTWVWSGFYELEEVRAMIDDIWEDDADEGLLFAAIASEFQKKIAAEALWPKETDCDRLDLAFETLNANAIIALQNAGYTMSDGLSDISEELAQRGHSNVHGYCFYHGQDLERALSGGGLTLAFGAFDNDKTAQVEVGNLVKDALEANGFAIDWDGDSESRINIPNLDWKRRQMLLQNIDFQGISFITDLSLNLISIQEVEAVEALLGFAFPEDYRKFVSTLGVGGTEFSLRVWSPQDILDDHLPTLRDRLSAFWFWDKSPELLTQARAVECVPFFDSSCGDDIIFHPSDRNRWFILQHEADTVAVVHSFQELCAFYLDDDDLHLDRDDELQPSYKFDNYG